MKFILHSVNPSNLVLMARAAERCSEMDLEEGVFGLLEYNSEPPTLISYVKRKSCVTLFEYAPRNLNHDN